MGDRTKIGWTSATWNPIRGCSRVSEGCRNCYAERVAARFSGPGQPYEGLARRSESGPKWTGEVRFIPEKLDQPLRWQKPRRIFVNSMSDLFHEGVKTDWIDQIVGMMASADQHTYQVLTKRPERMRDYAWDWVRRTSSGWPKHIHMGTSVEDQATANERIPLLLDVPPAVRFLSIEPLLSPIDLLYPASVYPNGPTMCCNGTDCGCRGRPVDPPLICGGTADSWINWVIIGGESGPHARQCGIEWVRAIVDQCRQENVACFVKQLGARPTKFSRLRASTDWDCDDGPTHGRVVVNLKSRAGSEPKEWPEDLRVQEFPTEMTR